MSLMYLSRQWDDRPGDRLGKTAQRVPSYARRNVGTHDFCREVVLSQQGEFPGTGRGGRVDQKVD